MKPAFNDLRLLKLAEMYEESYERFVLHIATQIVEDEELRRGLMRLADPADRHHERIVAQMQRLNAQLGEQDKAGVVRAALLDVCEVERAARDFYLQNADHVHDPEVAQLFRALAREEDAHAHIADGVLALADKKLGRFATEPSGSLQLLGGTPALPFEEGTRDFGGPSTMRRPPRRGGTP